MHELLRSARAVIFDFDGVLVDSEPLHAEAIRRVGAERGWAMSHEQFLRMVGKGDEHAFELLARESGARVSEPEVAALCERKHVECLRLIEEGRFSVQSGAAAVVAAAADRVPIGVCSGSRRGVVMGMLHRTGFGERMRTVVTHEDVRNPKPAPEGYLLAASILGVGAARCVVVEDSPTGIRAAKSAGMAVIAVGHSFPKEQLGEADAFVGRIASLV
ncbi:MAG: HAD family phosphatase [Phycisphaerales bacterium]|nr:HAD family phosphatase [Phycisphaerales bacterium]